MLFLKEFVSPFHDLSALLGVFSNTASLSYASAAALYGAGSFFCDQAADSAFLISSTTRSGGMNVAGGNDSALNSLA